MGGIDRVITSQQSVASAEVYEVAYTMTRGALWRRFVRHKALIHEQICQCQHPPRTRILRRRIYARKKTAPSPPLSTYLSAGGTEASLNKRLIIHPDLNNRHSPTIVSFPYESPRRARLKIVCASITRMYIHVRPIITIHCGR